MKLIPVESMPKRRYKHHLQDLIEEFVHCDSEIVMIDFSEQDYKSPQVCASCLRVAAKRSGHPVKASVREDKVFLFKV